MLDRQLRIRLGPLAKRLQLMELWRFLGGGWALAFIGAFAVYWLRREGVKEAWEFWPLASVLGLAVGVTGFAFMRFILFRIEYVDLIRLLVGKHPEAKTLLETAIEQQPLEKGAPLNFFQARLLDEAIAHAKANDWKQAVATQGLLYRSSFSMWMACAYFFFIWQILVMPEPEYSRPFPIVASAPDPDALPVPANLPEIDPGDAEIEAGTSLLVTATFAGSPDSAPVLQLSPGTQVERSFTMASALEDPIYAVRLPSIDADNSYKVVHPDGETRLFSIKTYVHPALVKADALVGNPEYTGLPDVELEDVKKLSVPEGGTVTFSFILNKPVDKAALQSSTAPSESLPAQSDPKKPTCCSIVLSPQKSANYTLHLQDAEGRQNKLPPRFQVTVVPNNPPKIKQLHPRGDIEASSLQELQFEAQVSDDYGLYAYGLTYNVPGQEAKEILLHDPKDIKPGKAAHLLPLEEIGLEPDDLVTWHFWAEDRAADGSMRRIHSDINFAEIRPFEHIYREGIPQEGEPMDGAQKKAEELVKSQKLIITATWNLLHDLAKVETFAGDAATLVESQEALLAEVQEAVSQFDDNGIAEILGKAAGFMQQAVDSLKDAKESEDRKALSNALSPEESAYAQLLKMRARVTEIMRSKQGKGKGRSNNSQQQEQLDNLDLKDKEDRYETADQLSQEEQQQQKEDRQTLNHLRELAKRQEDLAKKIKDLNAAMQQATEPKENEEIQNQLKRLREQQREQVADVDDLQERMQRQQDPQRNSEAREQIQQTRQQMNQASKALEQNSLEQAQNASARAHRKLEELRDEFREKVASKLQEQMRQMRGEARDLEEQQKEIVKKLDTEESRKCKRLTYTSTSKPLAAEAEKQLQRTETLLEQMKEVTQETENSEPLVSRKLYESLRNRPTEQLKEDLQASSELLERQFLPQAKKPLENAAQTLSGLRQDIDDAAKHVLGDPKEALRRAKAQAQKLQEQVKDEISRKAQDPQIPTGEAPKEGEAQALTNEKSDDPNAPQRPASTQSQESQTPSGEAPQPGQPQGLANSSPQDPVSADKPSNGNPNGSQPPSAEEPQQGEQDGGKPSPGAKPVPGKNGNQNPELGFGTNTGGPMTGEDYLEFSDNLRDLEELIESPKLRNKAAAIREKARSIRKDFKRHGKEPQWDQVKEEVLNPLAELHGQLDEELRKLDNDNSDTPIDRDPVPKKYLDLVQQYYDELAK